MKTRDYIYDDYGYKVTEARVLPHGNTGNIICGVSGYLNAMEARRESNEKNAPKYHFPTPKWEDLKIYWKDGKYY